MERVENCYIEEIETPALTKIVRDRITGKYWNENDIVLPNGHTRSNWVGDVKDATPHPHPEAFQRLIDACGKKRPSRFELIEQK